MCMHRVAISFLFVYGYTADFKDLGKMCCSRTASRCWHPRMLKAADLSGVVGWHMGACGDHVRGCHVVEITCVQGHSHSSVGPALGCQLSASIASLRLHISSAGVCFGGSYVFRGHPCLYGSHSICTTHHWYAVGTCAD